MAIKVSFKALRALLGKPVADPAVVKVLAACGKVSIQAEYVIAKEAGFDFSLDRPDEAPRTSKKVLSTLFLYPEGRDKHRGFVDMPPGFAWTTRAALLAALPAPTVTWKIGKGKVPVTTPDPSHDSWTLDGLSMSANYREGAVSGVQVTLAEDADAGREVSTHPLHFETKPVDAPPDAELVGMALLVAWAAEKFGLPAKHAASALGKQLVKRAITPRAFLIGACGKTLNTNDFDPKLDNFVWGYTHRMFLGDDKKLRAKTDKPIAKLLGLHRADERAYPDDFLATFKGVVKNPFHVPDSWAAIDRIAPVLDARWADFAATAFERAPDLKLYERAVKLRDAVAITAAKIEIATASADDTLAADLLAALFKPLSDKAVQAVLVRAGMPIGKKIDEQANPLLGVSYLGAKRAVGDKRVLAVADLTFYAAKQKSYVRGLGKKVEFRGFPGPMVRGIAMGAARADVAKAFGKPKDSSGEMDYWFPSAKHRIAAKFSRAGKLVQLNFGEPADWIDPPAPPFTGIGLL